jgi:hypothetical protein
MHSPREVDEVVCATPLKAADESSYITGSKIDVDRGAIAI